MNVDNGIFWGKNKKVMVTCTEHLFDPKLKIFAGLNSNTISKENC